MTGTYRVFGRTIASEFPFTFHLPAGAGPPDLTFELGEEALGEEAGASSPVYEGPPAYESPFLDGEGRSALTVFQRDSVEILKFPGVAEFQIHEDRILYRSDLPERRDLIEIRFLGTVLSFFLERAGLPVLHASVVDVQGAAVAFLGTHQGGKTGLAATFLQAGYSLLSDDLAPLKLGGNRIMVQPGYPQMRVWPDLGRHLVGPIDELPRVIETLEKRRIRVGRPEGFGEFCTEPRPLAAIYLPQRKDSSVETHFEALGRRDAVVELMRMSFLARVVDSLGWQSHRIEVLALIAATVPVRRLLYPSGFENLARVRGAILEDLDR